MDTDFHEMNKEFATNLKTSQVDARVRDLAINYVLPSKELALGSNHFGSLA